MGQQFRQEPHQSPGEGGLVQRRAGRDDAGAQHPSIAFPEKTPRQSDTHRGTDALMGCQGPLQPFGNAVALDEKDFLFQRLKRVLAQPFQNGIPEPLQTVAVEDDKARFDFRMTHAGVGTEPMALMQRTLTAIKRALLLPSRE